MDLLFPEDVEKNIFLKNYFFENFKNLRKKLLKNLDRFFCPHTNWDFFEITLFGPNTTKKFVDVVNLLFPEDVEKIIFLKNYFFENFKIN